RYACKRFRRSSNSCDGIGADGGAGSDDTSTARANHSLRLRSKVAKVSDQPMRARALGVSVDIRRFLQWARAASYPLRTHRARPIFRANEAHTGLVVEEGKDYSPHAGARVWPTNSLHLILRQPDHS